MASTPTTALIISMARKRIGSGSVCSLTQDSGKTVTRWNSAKLASGANAPRAMARHSLKSVPKGGEGCRSRVSNRRWNSGVATSRRRANSATTFTARATKKG